MNSFTRRDFVRRVGAATIAGALFPEALAERPGKKPNVLFIMADDFNTALSGYGHPQCRTPNLDRLARRGTTFTRAYCQFPLCGPSRASIMSGQYPLTNGVTRNGGKLQPETATLPRLFREAGYWTGRVSKIYHMGVPGHIFTGDDGTDHEESWIERYNVSVMESITPGKAEDLMLADSVHLYEDLRKDWPACEHKGGKFMIPEGNHQGSDFVVVETDGGNEALADGVAATKAIELLRQRAGAKRPFFLAVGFVRPHVPLVAPRKSFDGYDAAAMKLPELRDGDLDDIPAAARNGTNEKKYKLSLENQKKVLRGYYASVTYMDEQVGRLLDELDGSGLGENTIVVFVSDHGYHLGEHTMWQKLSLMEESIRVPLIVSAPGQRTVGEKNDCIVELLDIYPTLAELADLDAPRHLQGSSFADLLRDPNADCGKEDAFIQVGNGFCLRTDRWACMRYEDKKTKAEQFMLYDMNADPKQYTNLSGDPEFADVEGKLQKRLAARVASAREARAARK
jgi:iduronate 2-sulfatase